MTQEWEKHFWGDEANTWECKALEIVHERIRAKFGNRGPAAWGILIDFIKFMGFVEGEMGDIRESRSDYLNVKEGRDLLENEIMDNVGDCAHRGQEQVFIVEPREDDLGLGEDPGETVPTYRHPWFAHKSTRRESLPIIVKKINDDIEQLRWESCRGWHTVAAVKKISRGLKRVREEIWYIRMERAFVHRSESKSRLSERRVRSPLFPLPL
jgi:hypothetical protein